MFAASIEAIEYWLLLNTEPRTCKWRWICETYIQWYPLTSVLSELFIRTDGERVDRGLDAVDAAIHLSLELTSPSDRKGGIESNESFDQDAKVTEAYKPLCKLWSKARVARTQSLTSEYKASENEIGDNDLMNYDTLASLAFPSEYLNFSGVGSEYLTLDGSDPAVDSLFHLQLDAFPDWPEYFGQSAQYMQFAGAASTGADSELLSPNLGASSLP
jgi:hypothetical protein